LVGVGVVLVVDVLVVDAVVRYVDAAALSSSQFSGVEGARGLPFARKVFIPTSYAYVVHVWRRIMLIMCPSTAVLLTSCELPGVLPAEVRVVHRKTVSPVCSCAGNLSSPQIQVR